MRTSRFFSSGGGLPPDADPPCRQIPWMQITPVNRQTGVKTLPCLKLRLRAVINLDHCAYILPLRIVGDAIHGPAVQPHII